MRYATLCFIYVLGVLLLSGCGRETPQGIEVQLAERTPDDQHSFSLAPFRAVPQEELTLPDVNTSQAQFTHVYGRIGDSEDRNIAVMVLPDSAGERLFIDTNNDNDLTNDGPPRLFPSSKDSLVFYVHSDEDPKQRIGRVLMRWPYFLLGDPEGQKRFAEKEYDAEGNFSPRMLRVWQIPHPDFEGKKGTFYYPKRLGLSRGQVTLGGVSYNIGVLDFNTNGRFDDRRNEEQPQFSDVLLIDLNRDDSLKLSTTTEVFKLYDVFEVGGTRYEVAHVDPYGQSLRLVETEEAPTNYYVKGSKDGGTSAQAAALTPAGELDASFWALELQTLSGETIAMEDFKGQHLLLNFWGEWCAPCIEEIPELVAMHEAFPSDRLQMVSLLNTFDRPLAEQIIEERQMQWPQVEMDEALKERFKIVGWPTNLLVLPDGAFMQTGQISRAFVEQVLEK